MKFNYDSYDILILIDKNLTKEKFLERSGAQDGYSYKMFSRMFDSIFSELINVEDEYKNYYLFEYDSLEQYLFKKYNVDDETIDQIMEQRKRSTDLIIYRKDEFSYGDYGIMQFAFSDTLYKRVTNLLLNNDRL